MLGLMWGCQDVGTPSVGSPADTTAPAPPDGQLVADEAALGLDPIDGDFAGEAAWTAPPVVVVEPPRAPGIPDCAPEFVAADGTCSPKIALCRKDQLVIPSRGCVDPVRVPWIPAGGAAVLEVYSDAEVAAGMSPGLAEAVALAPAGAVLQLRAGVFTGGVVIDKPLVLQGQGVGATLVEGVEEDVPTVDVVGAAVDVLDLTLEGRRVLTARDGAAVHVERLFSTGLQPFEVMRATLDIVASRIASLGVHAVAVGDGELRLSGVAFPAPTLESISVVTAGEDQRIVVNDSVIEGPRGIGGFNVVDVDIRGSAVETVDVLARSMAVVNSRLKAVSQRAPGGGGPLLLQGCVVEEVRSYAPTAILDTVVSPPVPSGAVDPALVTVGPGSELTRVTIAGGAGDGLRLTAPSLATATYTLRHVTIRGTGRSPLRPGVALSLEGRVVCDAEDVRLEGMADIGVNAKLGATLNVRRLQVVGGPPSSEHPYRFGILAGTTASLVLEDTLVQGTTGLGIWAKGPGTTLVADGLWLDGVYEGVIVDVDQGTLNGVADAVLVSEGADGNLKRFWARGADRASLHSALGTGRLVGGHLSQCAFGFVTRDALEHFALEGVVNGCDVPIYSASELVVPSRVRL